MTALNIDTFLSNFPWIFMQIRTKKFIEIRPTQSAFKFHCVDIQKVAFHLKFSSFQ